MSQIGISHQPYILPAMQESVPPEWKSSTAPKPVASTVQTVAVSSLSAAQNAGGHIDLSLPLGSSAGHASQMYVKFNLSIQKAAHADTATTWCFKGASRLCTSLFSRYTTSVNGVVIDSINSFAETADLLLTHASSADWLRNDAGVLMGACKQFSIPAATTSSTPITFVMPLIGFLSGNIPLYLMNGMLNIGLDLNPVARAIRASGGGAVTGYTISGVQVVYDRVSLDQSFIDQVRAEIAQGQQYVIPMKNIQTTSTVESGGNNNLSLGLNVSSCESVLMSQILTADQTTIANFGYSLPNGLSQFSVSADGRLVSAINQTYTERAVMFAEAQKALSRAFSADCSDPCGTITVADGIASALDLYETQSFFAGQSLQRCSSDLSFKGTPVSVLNLQWTAGAVVDGATYTAFVTVISGYQCLIDAAGNVTLVR